MTKQTDTSHEHAAHIMRKEPSCSLCDQEPRERTTFAPIVMVLYSRDGAPKQVCVGSAMSASDGWAALPMLASLAGFTRDERLGNVWHRDGRSYVGSWIPTEVAAADAVIYAPSTYAPTRIYRRRRVLDALAVLRTAGYPLDRLASLPREVAR